MTPDDVDLVKVARTDSDIGVRRIAIEKIEEARVLADIAAAETERSLRDFAGERAAQLWTSKACSGDEELANDALSGLLKMGDQRAIVDVAHKAQLAAIRKRAFGELRDPRALADLAKSDAPQDLRLAAVARIDDGDVLRAIAIDTTVKEVGLAAVDKLDDADRLDNIANKAKNKAVRQRARKIAQEMAAAEKAKKTPVVPDEVKRRKAEKAQLVRELESLADTFDFEKHSAKVTASEAAWKELGSDDGDERFTKAAARFWKRKEAYEQQARTADELRAVEREAQKERDRAAAERAAQEKAKEQAAKPEAAPAEAADDPARLAREAEAKARREERDARKAEDDARRAAEQEAREARRKEDAERATALAASLTAMIEDMEKLAADGSKDGRSIDRLLQQAGRSFEQIGKLAGDQRDALSDRYTAARGKLVVRASELREGEEWQRFQNVPKAEALIAAGKEMAAEDPSPSLGNRLRDLQALWKEVGPMPQRRSKELWEQFKKVCDDIYDKVKGYRAVETEKFGDVAKAKEALIAEAESLADKDVTQETANALKALQTKWKESGHLPRKQGDELWKRFRAACDKFFERRKPMLDAEHAEQAKNLSAKQELIARAQKIADGAPGEGGWGKAIGQIKDLQQEWKAIGYVPRRDADAVYKAFRAACDALFAKRDESRDAEANAHRDAIDDIKGEIADVLVGGDDVVAKALELRAKARELDSRDLAKSIEQMVRHVVTANPEAVKGTELDPAALKARREKVLAKVEELLPKQAPGMASDAAPADIAAQLKQAMQKNAFGDLRFSGRDPVEVVDELRTQWIEAGPLLDDEDRAQGERFEELSKRVLDAAGAAARADRDSGGDDGGRRRRRDERGVDDSGRRRDRRVAAPPIAGAPVAQAESPNDAVTQPVQVPAMRAPAAAPVAKPAPAPVAKPTPAPIAKPTPMDSAAAPTAVVDSTSVSTPAPVAKPAPVAAPTPAAAPIAKPTPGPSFAAAPAPARSEGPASAAAAAGLSDPPPAAIPHTAHDAITAPAQLPFQPLPAPAVSAAMPDLPPVSASTPPITEPPRASSSTMVPPMDDLDGGWDLGDDDPTATTDDAQAAAAADAAMERPDPPTPPSSSDMAGDGSTGGDGIDEPGWD